MLKNGIVWKDTQGNPIHAHGGYMISMRAIIIGMVRIEEIISMSAAIAHRI